MSYTANQYNYATPLSSAAGLVNSVNNVVDKKYATLFDNTLNGTYYPVSGDVGLWGASIADASGVLSEPFVVTIDDEIEYNAFRLVGSSECFPVTFTVKFYNGSSLVYTIAETSNNKHEYMHYLSQTVEATRCVITVTKISQPGGVARLYNVYNPAYIKRADIVTPKLTEITIRSDSRTVRCYDTLHLAAKHSYGIHNTIRAADSLKLKSDGVGRVDNIHSVMKRPSRRIYGKVYITYNDPMLSTDTAMESNGTAYNSVPRQITDGVKAPAERYFTLYENDLSGAYVVSDEFSQVGWSSKQLSCANGRFDAPFPYLRADFAPRPVVGISMHFNDVYGSIPTDFTVRFFTESGGEYLYEFVDNTDVEVPITNDSLTDVVTIIITVSKVSKPNTPAVIMEIPIMSTFLYEGYQDMSKLISIDLLEELTYEDEIEALGGVSANETRVVLDNSSKDFFFNSGSIIASQLLRNRKIEPWLGAEITPGVIEWYKLGTFWSYRWNVPTNTLTATVVGFDTLGLLNTTYFINHQVLINKSIGELIEYVIEDAKKSLDFLEYDIGDDLYDIIIPYAWFEPKSHTAALRKISGCYPMHIYCDRNGVIKAMSQKLHLDFYYDVWADDTNVIDKTYDSLHTALPNIVNVTVKSPAAVESTQLATDTLIFSVEDMPDRTIKFSKPYLSDLLLTIDCDDTVSYTYAVYSWGIEIAFTGTGYVRSITCAGTAVDAPDSSVITSRNDSSIKLNGAITRDVSSDFIQTSELANMLISRIRGLAALDKYDASVDYRGDISLTINDPILLLNGIAPDNRYNIKRHQLFWNGSLSGSADLNT